MLTLALCVLSCGCRQTLGRRGANEDLFSATFAGNTQLAKDAIHRGADVNEENDFEAGLRPLMVAADKDDDQMVRLLLRHGANPNLRDHDGRTASERTRNKKIQDLLTRQPGPKTNANRS